MLEALADGPGIPEWRGDRERRAELVLVDPPAERVEEETGANLEERDRRGERGMSGRRAFRGLPACMVRMVVTRLDPPGPREIPGQMGGTVWRAARGSPGTLASPAHKVHLELLDQADLRGQM